MMLLSHVPIPTAVCISIISGLVSADAYLHNLKSRAATTPQPIVVPASQDWDGVDGPWSSHAIQIGTPPQNVKVFVSTGAYQTLVVVPEGCNSFDPSNCALIRGGEFFINQSTTWENNTASLISNVYPLGLEARLGLVERGLYGFDDITLGWQGSGGPRLLNQTIGGIATEEFFLGVFGLNPRPTNFTTFNDPTPSFVRNLRESGLIPSTSWSYTAGNRYRLNQVLASLTLGGYDTSKYIPNDISWSFNGIDTIDLTVNIQAITSNTSSASILSTPIAAYIDSSIPHLWLPSAVCDLFETDFGLTYNSTLELYLVNDTQHSILLSQNPALTFTLGNLSSSQFTNITLPYAAFDLLLSPPLVASPTRYFPLKRAANDSQYTLGRTFFQEAYVIADYDRRNFSVSQCNWDASVQQNIVSILAPSSSANSSISTNSSAGSRSPHLSVGIIAGIAIGAFVIIIAVLSLTIVFVIKPRRRAAAAPATEIDNDTEGSPTITLNQPLIAEVDGVDVCETDGIPRCEAGGTPLYIYELPANEEVAAEALLGEEAATNDEETEIEEVPPTAPVGEEAPASEDVSSKGEETSAGDEVAVQLEEVDRGDVSNGAWARLAARGILVA